MTPQQINSIQNGLSSAKLQPYQALGFQANSKELVHAYFALQDASAHLFLPLQMLELSLRNNIHNVWNSRLPPTAANNNQVWYDYIPHTQQSQKNVRDAKVLANRSHPNNYTSDDVVCALTIGFWVSMLDKHYRDRANQHRYLNHEYAVLFPGRNSESIRNIHDQLKAINTNRNRLYHHEPVWKHSSVVNLRGAMAQLENVYDSFIKVLILVSPEKKNLMDTMGFKAKFHACCSAYIAQLQPNP